MQWGGTGHFPGETLPADTLELPETGDMPHSQPHYWLLNPYQ